MPPFPAVFFYFFTSRCQDARLTSPHHNATPRHGGSRFLLSSCLYRIRPSYGTLGTDPPHSVLLGPCCRLRRRLYVPNKSYSPPLLTALYPMSVGCQSHCAAWQLALESSQQLPDFNLTRIRGGRWDEVQGHFMPPARSPGATAPTLM